jgi:hypothetical protein
MCVKHGVYILVLLFFCKYTKNNFPFIHTMWVTDKF